MRQIIHRKSIAGVELGLLCASMHSSMSSHFAKAGVLVLALLFSQLGVSLAAETKNVRVVFWNMEWFPGGHPQASTTEVVDQISIAVPAVASLEPQIFCVEEILGPKAIAISLYKTPGVVPQVCSEFLDDKGEVTLQQIGIASSLPAVGGWWENWKPAGITPKRGFSFAAFEPVPGKILLVYVVHLKSNRGELSENIPMREESAKQLLKHAQEMEKAYGRMGKVGIVIGGDFNTSLDDPKFADEKTLGMFKKAGFDWAWEGIPFEDRVTLPSTPSRNPNFPPFPDACFDHVFTKGVKVASASVAAFEHNPSDHRPVIVDLEYPAPAVP